MWFGVLGPLEVRAADGSAVPVGGPRARALLIQLALCPGRVVPVEQLLAGQDAAPNAVQAQVSRLRRSLPSGLIEFDRRGYRLAVDPDDVDAVRFERLAMDGRRLLVEGRFAAAASILDEALALWRGPLELSSGHPVAVRLTELRLEAVEDLLDAQLALPSGASVSRLRALVAENPLRERLRGQLMRALQAAGRPAEALAEYERVRQLLAEEMGADPSAELAAVHLEILRAERPALPRLPAQLTSFVGRSAELARVASLLSADVRLVTLVGPGGIGKTRLALEAGARGAYEACFVDLSVLPPGGGVVQAVLGALGRRETGFQASGPEPLRRLVAALAGRELLLILDNCEQVVEAVAVLARELLNECPRLRVLATSREPLGVTGEALVWPAPLEAETEAVRLFVDRAAAVVPGFAATPELAALCAELDGLPLAIELAAARTRQFTSAELAARLDGDERFRLLSRGDRTAAARHRTLRAVVAWSWDLLDPSEQELARRFSVFNGSASLSAVGAICGASEERLADLVDKSLVEINGGRYRMLETIRLFCADQLADSGEGTTVRGKHARYFLSLAQTADPHLRRASQLDWIARLSAEHGNLTAALRWAAIESRPTAFELVAALAAYWWLSGRSNQAGEVAAELLNGEIPDGMEEEYVSCVVHAVPRAAPEHWTRAEETLRTFGRPLRYPFGAAFWGMAAGPSEALAAGADVPEWERILGADPWTLALARLSRAMLTILAGRIAEGERELTEVLECFRELGERWGTAQSLDFLALVAAWRGEWPKAYAHWQSALEALAQLGAQDECAEVLCRRAECRRQSGDLDGAAADYRLAGEHGTQPEPAAAVLLGLGRIARLRGDARTGGDLLRRALAAVPEGAFDGHGLRNEAYSGLALLAEASGDRQAALNHYADALAAVESSWIAVELATAAEGRAGAALLAGSPERAALLLGVGVALRSIARVGDPDVAELAERARAALGADAFATFYAQGAAMPADEARAVLFADVSER